MNWNEEGFIEDAIALGCDPNKEASLKRVVRVCKHFIDCADDPSKVPPANYSYAIFSRSFVAIGNVDGVSYSFYIDWHAREIHLSLGDYENVCITSPSNTKRILARGDRSRMWLTDGLLECDSLYGDVIAAIVRLRTYCIEKYGFYHNVPAI